YLGYKFLEFLAFITPYPISYIVASTVAAILYFFRVHVPVLEKNVSIALNIEPKSSRTSTIVRKIYTHWFRNVVDFLKHPYVRGDNFKKRIELEGVENLDEALKKGRGVVIFTAHLGNFEWGACRIAVEGYKIWGTGLTRPYKKTVLFFENRRLSKGLKTLYVNKIMINIFRILKNNEIIAIPADFDPLGTARTYSFFGHLARLPSGPVEIAMKSGAQLLPSFIWRKDKYNHHQIIGKPVDITAETGDLSDRQETISRNMEKMIGIMEKYIKDHIEQWELFHDIWA
ncbi:MAG: lysophospholipid acyltransferase family protein, partial [Actinobacteria bacterium]|nr:lysophospholipid acyltransferase family protein [Actinomycetota bacterium]